MDPGQFCVYPISDQVGLVAEGNSRDFFIIIIFNLWRDSNPFGLLTYQTSVCGSKPAKCGHKIYKVALGNLFCMSLQIVDIFRLFMYLFMIVRSCEF